MIRRPPISPPFPYPPLSRSPPPPTRLAPEGGAGARARALPLHLGLELAQRVVGHGEAEVRERLLREVGREAVRVVEREQEVTVDDADALGRVRLGVLADLRDPDVERLGEALLLAADHALHARHLGAQLGVRPGHDLPYPLDHPPEKGLAEAEHPTVAH